MEKDKKIRRYRTRKPLEITKEMFLEELGKNNGDYYKTYTSMGLNYNTYYKWRCDDEDFNQKCIDAKKKTVEFVEKRLFDKIAEGDPSLIKFFLSCKAGYVMTKNVVAKVDSNNDVNVKAVIDEIKKDLK